VIAFAGRANAQEADTPDIWLPWEGGAVWRYMAGPHTASSSVADALDLQPPDAAGQTCEAFTSAFWAVAAADGRAIVMPNAVEVDHGGGFRTGYYHLADKQVSSGEEVKAGQRLGRPGCCPDGGTGESCWASEPHMHFYTAGPGGRRPIEGTHVGGWLVNTDGCLVRPDRRACPGAALISNAPRYTGGAAAPTAITVAVDVSGSMDDEAKNGELLRLVAPYLRAAAAGEPVNVLRFNSHARVVTSAGEPRLMVELVSAIRGVKPDGNTDLQAGLGLACREMQARGPEVKQALVLITDGYHNGSRLWHPEKCFVERGWPVFALGLGQANANLLERVSGATGGSYRPAGAIFDPACEMERLKALVAEGRGVVCSRFLLRNGERLVVPVAVPPEQQQASLVVTSVAVDGDDEQPQVNVLLQRPDGDAVTNEFVLAHEKHGNGERYAIGRPAVGMWKAMITGKDLPESGVFVDLSFGTTPTAFANGLALTNETTPAATEDPGEEVTATPTESPDATDTETPTPAPTRPPRSTLTPAPTPTPTPVRPTPPPTR
jgi:hypothetical protein